MSGSRCLILTATLAVVLCAPGCDRDYKAPKPKTSDVAELGASRSGTGPQQKLAATVPEAGDDAPLVTVLLRHRALIPCSTI
jgi:hypothetical protein